MAIILTLIVDKTSFLLFGTQLRTKIGMWINPKFQLARLADRVRHALGLTFPDEELGGRIRAEQIRAVLRLTPLAVLSNLFNVGIIVYALAGLVPAYALAIWAIPVTGVIIIPVRGWLLLGKRTGTQSASPRAIRRMSRNAAILAILWGLLTVSFFNQVDTVHQLLIACLISGLMFGGAFILAAVPSAAIVYVIVMTIASLIPLEASNNPLYYHDMAALLSIYACVLVISVLWNGRIFIDRLLAEAGREQQSQWISLLLRDFEESASDWLWQTDSVGRLQHVSPRFSEILCQPIDELRDMPFVLLLGDSEKEKAAYSTVNLDTLRGAMKNRIAFRDLIIPVAIAGADRWWSLTGKPILDEHGVFTGYRGVGRDVTLAKRAEEELGRTRSFLDTVIENIPATIFVKDALERRFVFVNRAGENLLGVARGHLIGKRADEVFSQEQAADFVARDDEVIKSSSRIVIEEHALETPHNGVRLVTTQVLGIAGQNGAPNYILGVIEDVTERKRAEARIAHLARHDSLTDLPNRATFNEHLRLSIEHGQSTGSNFAILCIDLDRFKEVNDVYGHPLGDAVLRAVAHRLRAAANGIFLARVGGDEFALIMPNSNQETATALAVRLLDGVAEDLEIESYRIRQGLCVGVAIYPMDGVDARTLLANADAALYRAKAEGRRSIRFFDSDMDMQLRERRALQSELRSAVENDRMILHYQPQARIAGEIVGFEALVRWRHPTRGLVPPGSFIELAEESGVIVSIGEWVLREACREAASWPRKLQIAVNLSPVQFRSADLPTLVHTVLLETGLDPSRLELEITESVLIDDYSRAQSILRRLKSLGVRIALDDFGTGYSSLSYVQSFPFDKLKIDQSFVSNVVHNVQSAMIVRSVIGLARGLKIPVVAEGVETKAQLEFLAQESCDEIQGFLIGRPLPILEYAAVVGRETQPTLRRSRAG
jgi:diguanylate cyclase (GGDEF)-like protein/PAS domain S-box-containing protein